jgi:hypothetical protein
LRPPIFSAAGLLTIGAANQDRKPIGTPIRPNQKNA